MHTICAVLWAALDWLGAIIFEKHLNNISFQSQCLKKIVLILIKYYKGINLIPCIKGGKKRKATVLIIQLKQLNFIFKCVFCVMFMQCYRAYY